MKTILEFSVEDVNLIEENPDSNFAVMSLDFFASGKNLHDMWVSDETLEKTANTIVNCPLVWKYDAVLDDIYTHHKDEVPCGFVPESAEITSRKLEDGRTMLSVIAYVWKKYTGDLLNFFRRDGGKKPVSVEMSVYDMEDRPDGLIELKDFKYEAITILGSLVTPAIPLASAVVLSFAQEYKEAYEKEFLKIKVPKDVIENIKRGLELQEKYKRGTSTALAFGKYLIEEGTITKEKLHHMESYFKRVKEIPSEEYSNSGVNWLLHGGAQGKFWASETMSKIAKEEETTEKKVLERITFPYKSMKDVNPAIKGITPPVSLAQANQIANQAESIGIDDKKNGWAIAISSFKKTHVVKEGKWVKKEEMAIMDEKLEMAIESEEEKENISEEKLPEDQKEEIQNSVPNEEEEKAEKKAGEEEEGEEFAYPEGFAEKMAQMFSDEEEEEVKMAKAELQKGRFANPGVMMAGMFAQMCRMAKVMADMADEKKAYMSENEELKKFKADMEEKQKAFEVDRTLAEMAEKVVLSEEARDEMKAKAKEYSFSEIEQWKTYCKAKSFDFALKGKGKEDVTKVGFPFVGTTKSKDSDLWSN